MVNVVLFKKVKVSPMYGSVCWGSAHQRDTYSEPPCRHSQVGWPVPFLATFNFASVAIRYPFAAVWTVGEHPNYDSRVWLKPQLFCSAAKCSDHLATPPPPFCSLYYVRLDINRACLVKKVLIGLALSYPFLSNKAMQSSLYRADCTTVHFGAIPHHCTSWHHKNCDSLHPCNLIPSMACKCITNSIITVNFWYEIKLTS